MHENVEVQNVKNISAKTFLSISCSKHFFFEKKDFNIDRNDNKSDIVILNLKNKTCIHDIFKTRLILITAKEIDICMKRNVCLITFVYQFVSKTIRSDYLKVADKLW